MSDGGNPLLPGSEISEPLWEVACWIRVKAPDSKAAMALAEKVLEEGSNHHLDYDGWSMNEPVEPLERRTLSE